MGFAIIVTSEVLRFMKLGDDDVESTQERMPRNQGTGLSSGGCPHLIRPSMFLKMKLGGD